MSAAGQALDLALACYRAPPRLAQAAQRPLPDDLLVLLRLAAGDEALAQECADAAHESIGTVVDAAVFFIQQVLFAPGTDSYRALGVNPDAPDARIKEHYRWLVRWLHPDRNPDEWDAIYADRVNRAWQDLRQPERRAAYDLAFAESLNHTPVGAASAATPFARTVAAEAAPTKAAAPARVRISAEHPATPLLSGRTAQRMPLIVLGTLGAVAGAALALMWYAQTPRPAPPPLVAAAEAEAPAALTAPAAAISPVGAASAATAPAEIPPESVAAEAAPTEALAASVAEPAPPAPPQTVAVAPSGERAPRTVKAQPVGAASAATALAKVPAKSVATEAAPTVVATPVMEVAATAAPEAPAATPAAAVEPAATEAPPPATAPITEAAAQQILGQYTAAYAAGDIRSLMRLFTRDATNNRGNRDAIAYDYQELFSNSEAREIQLSTTGWLAKGNSATVLAKYEAKVKRPGRWLPSTSRGDIRFDFAYENGALRIRNIRHD